MRTTMRTIIFLSLLVIVTSLKSQNIDSLRTALKNAKHDTTRCNILNALIEAEPNEGICERYCDDIILIIEHSQNKSNSCLNILANAYNNKGAIAVNKGSIVQALEYLNKSLKIRRLIGDQKEISGSLLNIGEVFYRQYDLKKAEVYFNDALNIYKATKDSSGIALALFGLSKIYGDSKDLDKAIVFAKQAVDIQRKKGSILELAYSLNVIGTCFSRKGDYKTAIEYYSQSLDISKKLNFKSEAADNYYCIGNLYFSENKYQKAIDYTTKALRTGEELKRPTIIRNSARILYKTYQAQNQPAKALEMYQLYIKMRDSISNQETRKAVIQKQYQIEYEKKSLADSLKSNEERNIIILQNKSEINKRENQKIALYIGLALVLVFSTILFNRFQIIKKQKSIIENHQKEITDSINYAKRLQEAILPPQNLIKEHLPDSFILYKPKDIVAGDFYWLEKVNDLVLFAAADCTGHGVPGAMVSVVCSNALNRAVLEFGLTDPGLILDKTRELVIATFEKSGEEIKDGMDISLCCLNTKTNELRWAGANNPLWITKDGELLEFKANKQPIGICDDPKPFTTHRIHLKQGDGIYIFTDGYADQFGGPKGKKLMYKRFESNILSSMCNFLSVQEMNLDMMFENWKGNLDQVDDVCVIGVKI